jgi:hypothetical protein
MHSRISLVNFGDLEIQLPLANSETLNMRLITYKDWLPSPAQYPTNTSKEMLSGF